MFWGDAGHDSSCPRRHNGGGGAGGGPDRLAAGSVGRRTRVKFHISQSGSLEPAWTRGNFISDMDKCPTHSPHRVT